MLSDVLCSLASDDNITFERAARLQKKDAKKEKILGAQHEIQFDLELFMLLKLMS